MIASYSAQRWLCKLSFEYKNVKKNVIMDKHKPSDVIDDSNNFLRLMNELKPYTVKFEEESTMKPKKYLSDYSMESEERRQIIIINHDE